MGMVNIMRMALAELSRGLVVGRHVGAACLLGPGTVDKDDTVEGRRLWSDDTLRSGQLMDEYCGSPEFADPEVLRIVLMRDVWAVGVMLCQ